MHATNAHSWTHTVRCSEIRIFRLPTRAKSWKMSGNFRGGFLFKTLGTTFGGWSGHTSLLAISLSNSFQPKYTHVQIMSKCMVYLPTIYPLNYSVLQIHALHWQVRGALCFFNHQAFRKQICCKAEYNNGKYKLFLYFFSVLIQLVTHLQYLVYIFIYESTKASRHPAILYSLSWIKNTDL